MKAKKDLKRALRGASFITSFLAPGKSPDTPVQVAQQPSSSSVVVDVHSLVRTTEHYTSMQIQRPVLQDDVATLLQDTRHRTHQAWLVEAKLVLCRPPTDLLDPAGFFHQNSVRVVLCCDAVLREELLQLVADTPALRLFSLQLQGKHEVKRAKLTAMCGLVKTLWRYLDTVPAGAVALCDYSGSACASMFAIAMVAHRYRCTVLDAAVAVTTLWADCMQRGGSSIKTRMMPSSEPLRKAADAMVTQLMQTEVASAVAKSDTANSEDILNRVPAEFGVKLPPPRPVYTSRRKTTEPQKPKARPLCTIVDIDEEDNDDSSDTRHRKKRMRYQGSDDDDDD